MWLLNSTTESSLWISFFAIATSFYNAPKKYVDSCYDYQLFHQNSRPITFTLSNDGTDKATDISILISLPDGLKAMDAIEYKQMQVPQALKVLKNPIDVARRKHSTNTMMRVLAETAEIAWKFNELNSSSFSAGVHVLNDYNGWEINDKTIEFSIDELRHYSSKKFNQLYIAAENPGDYELDIELMCSEYREPVIQKLQIITE